MAQIGKMNFATKYEIPITNGKKRRDHEIPSFIFKKKLGSMYKYPNPHKIRQRGRGRLS